jgi:rSAM/selenodomain-associated transferase 2
MKGPQKIFELSIIIPLLDEERVLQGMFETLASQGMINFEVIISDGGSSDATCRYAEQLSVFHNIPITLVTTAKGRGVQLNAGAAAARGEHLLFLHADSRFRDFLALRKAVDCLAINKGGDVAAKFALRFERTVPIPSLPYFFYESKARLLRPECTHGDQGLMMHRDTLRKFGPFEGFPQMLAETRLAEKIRAGGELLLIPAEIFTSARRFETEGLYERQTVNAILMNCASQEWDEPFRGVSDLYRNQSGTGRMPIFQILETINKLIKGLPSAERRRFWRSTGSYVRRNAWQIAFFLDIRRNFQKGVDPAERSTPILDNYDRFVAPILDCKPFNLLATALTWVWFNLTRLYLLIFRN